MRTTSRTPRSSRAHVAVLGLMVGMTFVSAAHAQIGASADPSMPSTTTVHPVTVGGGGGGGGGGGAGAVIVENVALDPTRGPWMKELLNDATPGSPGSNILSGQ